MIRILKVMLFIMFVFSLSACRDVEEGGMNEKKEENIIEENMIEENDSKIENEDFMSNIELELTYKVPGKAICFDYTNKYQNIEYGYTEIFTIHTQKTIAFTSDEMQVADNLSDAHHIAWDKFLSNMEVEGYSQVNITSDEYVTINGIEMYRYEGTMPFVHEGTPFDGYAVGYTFIMDDVPCTLVGTVLEYEQSPELIEEVETMVEAMIQTLRTER